MNHPIIRKILSNSAILMAEKLVTMVVTLGVTVMLTRYLSPSDWERSLTLWRSLASLYLLQQSD